MHNAFMALGIFGFVLLGIATIIMLILYIEMIREWLGR